MVCMLTTSAGEHADDHHSRGRHKSSAADLRNLFGHVQSWREGVYGLRPLQHLKQNTTDFPRSEAEQGLVQKQQDLLC
eukprot:3147875-Amphidinium_carterae.1